MSLLSECQGLEPGYNGITNWTVLDEIDNVEEVSNEFEGDSRWETFHTAVFRRWGTGPHNSDEYVALHYSEPATEMQEGQDQSVAEFYSVEPYEVTVTKYRRV